MHSQDCNRSSIFVSHFEKNRHCHRVYSLLTVIFRFCVRRNYSDNLTGIEATRPTLASIQFQAEVNNSLNFFFSLQTYEKRFPEFPFQ